MRRRDDCRAAGRRGDTNTSRERLQSASNRLRRLALALLALLPALLIAACNSPGSSSSSPGGAELGQAKSALGVPVPQVSGAQPVWVFMKEQGSFAAARAVKDWTARGRMVHAGLTATAARTQAPLRAWLSSRNIEHKSFWIINAVKLDADQSLINEIAQRSDISRIVADPAVSLIQPIRSTRVNKDVFQTTEWGLDNIGAPRVWEEFGVRGEGIVVADIDTGAEFTHPALVAQYRGNEGGTFNHDYNWFDVIGDCADAPCDNFAHGTHTLGTMIGEDESGQNQIGVAPRAKWIATRPCDFSCTAENFVRSGEWVLAPTDRSGQNPRPDLRPHVVNNSWGFPSGDPFYLDIVRAWVDAGIFPAFAAGNEGSSCNTLRSPGDYAESFTVGAHDIGNSIAFFSSRGSSLFDGSVKPDLTAPGVDVRSSVPGGAYDFFSGTSMATPHLAGTVALLWSAAPALVYDVEATRAVLEQTAIDVSDLSCGGTDEDNNVWGEGRLDAYEAVLQAPRGPTGFLAGTVTSETGDPIANATVRVTGEIGTRTTRTAPDGAFTLRLPVGAYSASVTAFGFITESVSDVQITEDNTTPLDFALALAPSFAVSGTVRDHEGAPLAGATVSVRGTPIEPAITDENGQYLFPAVPQGEYDLGAISGPCFEAASSHVVVEADVIADFTLALRVDAAGYQCRPAPFEFIEASNLQSNVTSFSAPVSVELPFSFGHYGGVYDQVSIAGPGYISFVPETFADSFNQPIPAPFTPNAAVFAFWDDLWIEPGFAGSVYTETVGEAPNRRFVIEWRDAPVQFDMSQLVRFEIVLHETGEIGLAYHTASPSPLQRGGSATIGLEDETGTIGYQLSNNQPVLDSGTAVLFTSPPAGFVRGVVSDSNDGLGIVGATVTVSQGGSVVRSVTTDDDGAYALRLPVGDYVVEASKLNYSTESAPVSVVEGLTEELDFQLDTGRLAVAPGFLALTVPAGEQRSKSLVLSNTGTAAANFDVLEANGQRQNIVTTRTLERNPSFNPLSRTTKELFLNVPSAAASPFAAAGDVLRTFTPTNVFPYFVGFDGNVWISTFNCGQIQCGQFNHEFTPEGVATGRSFQLLESADVAGLSYDFGRDTMWQLAYDINRGRMNIVGWSTDSLATTTVITSNEQWTLEFMRGIAYRDDDDSFYVGGFSGTIYHVAGPASDTPGEVLGSCRPADGAIGDLAWNGTAGTLWVSTNSVTDTIYQLAPDDCTVLSTLGHPTPGFAGLGIDIDFRGNLWMVSQNTGAVYLVDSGVPLVRDVSWLTVTPSSGSVAPGSSVGLQVDVDASELEPGLYLATLVIESNAGSTPVLRVPVSLLVPAYQQALNSGGDEYRDESDDLWLADRRHQAGSFGYVQRGSTASTHRRITGTDDPALFRDQRVDPYAYRFDDVPNGVYQVELRFAELSPRVKLGERLFDVIVEDTTVLPAHDIAYEVGRFAADDNEFFVEVTDGRLDVRFIGRPDTERAVINALRVTHRPDR